MSELAGLALATIVGLVVGSFLTVVVTRLPDGRSVLWPRSACPACGRPLAARDLIPVLSWCWLGGRARCCGVPIPALYPLLEGATALAWALAYAGLGPGPAFARAAVLLTLLLAVTVIDLRHHIIPNRLVAAGALLLAPLAPLAGVPVTQALLGAVLGGGLLLAVAVVSRGGMGGGDVKLAAVLGLALGWRLTLVALVLAFVAGAVVAGGLLLAGRARRGDAIAFGPFLALGAVVALFWGEALLRWYLGLP